MCPWCPVMTGNQSGVHFAYYVTRSGPGWTIRQQAKQNLKMNEDFNE